MRRSCLLFGLLVVGSLLVGCSSDDDLEATASPDDSAAEAGDGSTCDEPEPAVDERDVAYATVEGVDPNLLSLDLSVPATCEPVPVVVWVHGGGWQAGDKGNAGVADKRELLNDAGYAFAAVNYRLSPDPVALDDPDRVTYPTHEQDVADALAYLDEHAEELHVDAGRIGLLGHSAGASIVSLLGTDESFLEGAGLDHEQLACTASLDTQAYDVITIASVGGSAGGSAGVLYQNAFTAEPEVWAAASPVNQIDGDEAPFLVVARGPAPRVEGARGFADLLDDSGVDATFLDANPYSHEDVSRQLGAEGDEVVTPAVLDLFAGCLS
jgi:acetyl esterase/lipase